MAGNTFGAIFCVSTFGESHGEAVGCIIDGCPAGLPISLGDIQLELARRKPGGGGISTTRQESDEPEILSGVFEGKTLGTPIAIIVRNQNQRSGDYDALKDLYRPGHADWCFDAKYGTRDYRGGGRSSARETIGRVAAGAVAKSFLKQYGIRVQAWTQALAGIEAPSWEDTSFNIDEIERNSLRVPSKESAEKIMKKVEEARKNGDSLGVLISCRVEGLPPGLGLPVFKKLDALLAGAILSIGACKGIEFGAGFDAADKCGSQNNDAMLLGEKTPCWKTASNVPAAAFAKNDAGGVLGGISTGMPLEFKAAFKPIPSISIPQQTIDKNGEAKTIEVKGRHDVCVCPRVVPVVEAMTALVLADVMLLARSDRV
jgi:chorismate synthase